MGEGGGPLPVWWELLGCWDLLGGVLPAVLGVGTGVLVCLAFGQEAWDDCWVVFGGPGDLLA